jgi:hypothetical protein
MLENIKKLFNSEPNIAVPEWANSLDSHQYLAFLEAFRIYFNQKKLPYTLTDGYVEVENNPFGFGKMGLTNLMQMCKQHETKDYSGLIANHFEGLIANNKFTIEFDKIVHDFDSVKQYIGVRLYAKSYVQHIQKDILLGFDFAEGIFAMLIFDLPNAVMNIKREHITAWGKTQDEITGIGIANMRTKYPLQPRVEKVGEMELHIVISDHFFTPNIVFDLEKHQGLVGPEGALVGLPHRHTAIIYPIKDGEVVGALNVMLPMIFGMNAEGPGSLSNHLYWYKDGVFTDLPYKIEGQNLQFYPTDSFIKMLEEVVGEEE